MGLLDASVGVGFSGCACLLCVPRRCLCGTDDSWTAHGLRLFLRIRDSCFSQGTKVAKNAFVILSQPARITHEHAICGERRHESQLWKPRQLLPTHALRPHRCFPSGAQDRVQRRTAEHVEIAKVSSQQRVQQAFAEQSVGRERISECGVAQVADVSAGQMVEVSQYPGDTVETVELRKRKKFLATETSARLLQTS